MSDPTKEQLQSSRKIIDVLKTKYINYDIDEMIRRVYNDAINDAANFLDHLAPHNPSQSLNLRSGASEIRKWLIIPSEELPT